MFSKKNSDNYTHNTLITREQRRRIDAFWGALVVLSGSGLLAAEAKMLYDNNNSSSQKTSDTIEDDKLNNLIKEYEKIFSSPGKNFDLEQFSHEDLMLIALELTTDNYDPKSSEFSQFKGLTLAADNGGVCRHKASFLVDFLNMFSNSKIDSRAYYITGAYIEDENNPPTQSNHAIVAWEYSLDGIVYDIFIDATSRKNWIFK